MQQVLSQTQNTTNPTDPTDFYNRVKTCKTCEDFHKELSTGVISLQAHRRLTAYKPTDRRIDNNISLFGDIFGPYYILQVISILYWAFWGEYKIYAGILGTLSIITLLIKHLMMKTDLQRLLAVPDFQTDVTVHRLSSEELDNGVLEPQGINSKFLVPGDLIEIQKHKTVPCNVILLKGYCIVNESLLTGDSTLVTKEELPNSREKTFDLERLQEHLLLGGTKVIETKQLNPSTPVLGVVLTTGFTAIRDNLEKEELLKARKIQNLGIWSELRLLYGMLTIVFLLESIVDFLSSKEPQDTYYLVHSLFETISLTFVPALPICLTIGQLISVMNFKRKGIFTRIGHRPDLPGVVQTMCFETNVLFSGDGEPFKGVRIASKGDSNRAKFDSLLTENFHDNLNFSSPTKTHTHELLELMATCHRLTSINGVYAGIESSTPQSNSYSGDWSDRKMFEATGWRIKESTSRTLFSVSPPIGSEPSYYKPTSEVHVLKRFAFSPERGTMSVIVSDPVEGKDRIYVKGTPETISRFCIQETVPEDLTATLRSYEQKGFEVVACATRFIGQEIDINNQLDSENLEKDLKFLGLFVFDRKPDNNVLSTINNVKEAGISPVMFTGENIMRAISEAKKCGIIEKDKTILYGVLKEPRNREVIEWRFIQPPQEENSTEEMAALIGNALINQNIRSDSLLKFFSERPSTVLILSGDILRSFCRNKENTLKAVWQKIGVCINMSSQDKIYFIKMSQKLGFPVGMCANGVENCSALAAADIGISSNQATTAVATFISETKDIKIVDIILKEGRSILNNYTQVIRSMFACYTILHFGMFILTKKENTVPEAHFLYQNVLVVLLPVVSVFFIAPSSGFYEGKSGKKNELKPQNIVFLQGLVSLLLKGYVMKSLRKQTWYIGLSDLNTSSVKEDLLTSSSDYERTVLFLLGNIQLFITLCAFAIRERSFRTLRSNFLYLLILGCSGAISLLILFVRIPIVSEILHINEVEVDSSFKWIMLFFAMAEAVAKIVLEKLYRYYFV